MLTVSEHDVARMRTSLFVEGADQGRRLSRFWALLTLAGVIASAGVVAESVATVIGAMIVAPLMVPILGIVLAIALGDRANLVRSVVLVVSGAASVVALAWLFGLLTDLPVLAETNSQVAVRVSPSLLDLIAALATGAVGAFAQVREDVSDTLPGVAIAISLVPPLAVVGLTLESGAPGQAFGALLLFLTNVVAILATGLVVMTLYRVPAYAVGHRDPSRTRAQRRNAVAVIAVLMAGVAAPLTLTTLRVRTTEVTRSRIRDAAEEWVEPYGWRVATVTPTEGTWVVRALGPPPSPPAAVLRGLLDDAGLASTTVVLELVPEERVELPGR